MKSGPGVCFLDNLGWTKVVAPHRSVTPLVDKNTAGTIGVVPPTL